MRITWLGTASLLLEAEGERLLFDPFVELRGGTNPNVLEDFLGEDTIFITHGHFDHLVFVPELMEQGDPTVYCTQTAAQTLETFLESGDRIVLIRPGMKTPVGKATVHIFQGRHIVFDRKLVLDTIKPTHFLRHAGNVPFLAWVNWNFRENGETLVYEVEAEGRRVMILGSLNLDAQEIYPVCPDLLVMPYQGRSDLPVSAEAIIERIKPKRILLSHFDDAFPPLSRDVDLRGLKKLMQEKYPQIPVVKPTAGKPVRIP